MTIEADIYKLLCQSSLGLKGGNNGDNVMDDMIVLDTNTPRELIPPKISIEGIVKVFEDYFIGRDILVEPSLSYPAIMYFLEGENRDVIGGVSVVQFERTLTLCFL